MRIFIITTFLVTNGICAFAQSGEEITMFKDIRIIEPEIHMHDFPKDIDNELNLLISGLFYIYKEFVSTQDGSTCNFTPSCSGYALTAIKKQGIVIGLINFFDRISRCNSLNRKDYPLHPKTRLLYDPV